MLYPEGPLQLLGFQDLLEDLLGLAGSLQDSQEASPSQSSQTKHTSGKDSS